MGTSISTDTQVIQGPDGSRQTTTKTTKTSYFGGPQETIHTDAQPGYAHQRHYHQYPMVPPVAQPYDHLASLSALQANFQYSANRHAENTQSLELAAQEMRRQQELQRERIRAEMREMEERNRRQDEHLANLRQQMLESLTRMQQRPNHLLEAMLPNLGNTHNPLPVVEVAPPPNSITHTCAICAEDFDKRASEASSEEHTSELQ